MATLVQGGNAPLFFAPTATRTQTVFAFGAERNREILTQPHIFASDTLRAPRGAAFLVDNMSAKNGDERREQRRMMMPAFTRDHLRGYHHDMVRHTARTLDGWRADQQIDLWHALETLCADIASQTFYGQDPTEQRSLHHRSLAGIARDIAAAMFSPVTMMSLNVPGSPYRRFLRLANEAEQAILAEVERKRAAEDPGDDVLAMMIKTQEAERIVLSDTELVGNAFTLFLAGHDVPANALGFLFYLLAQHPNVAADLEAELRPFRDTAPTFEQLWELPVLDRVVKESLRVLCPAVVLWRRTSEATTLGGFAIPTGTEVLFSPYVTHLDPERYPEPRRFVPDRWRDLKPSAFEYLPFSHGFRKCLGAAFAEALLRVVVAMTVPRFRIELIADQRVDLFVTFTMKPKRGLPVTTRAQDHRFERSPACVQGQLGGMVELPER